MRKLALNFKDRLSFEAKIWILVFTSFSCAYYLQFLWVRQDGLAAHLFSTLVNIGPILVLGFLSRQITRRWIINRNLLWQSVAHITLSVAFAHMLYITILIVAEFNVNWLTIGFSITPFYSAATQWQLFQGLFIYTSLQGLIYACYVHEQLVQARKNTIKDTKPFRSEALFIKSDGEYKQIAPQDIVHIAAMGDYVELHLQTGIISSNKSLNYFYDTLEEAGFLRAHRSHIVNPQAVRSAEPTGDGRLSLHLSNNQTIITSRKGAREFRAHTS